MMLLHYGLQRSGTNFLEALVRKKYRVRIENSDADRCSPLLKHFHLYDCKDIIPEAQYRTDIKISSFNDFERLFESPQTTTL